MGKTFGFVVLNYINYEETIECIDSILDISSNNYSIVIVDNDSPNNSIQVLTEKYGRHDNVRIENSGRNGGYSYGNNCGIRYFNSIGVHDLIIATSDTVIVSKDILQQLEAIDTEDVGIVGPRIKNLQNDDQNPMEWEISLKYILNIHFPAIAAFCRNMAYKVISKVKDNVGIQRDKLKGNVPYTQVYMIHGSFLYLTNKYLEKCGYLDESLFMYGEEDLLSYNCIKNGLKIVYQPGIEVLHKDARSTPKENNNSFTVFNSNASMKYLKQNVILSSLLSHYIRRL